MSKNKIVSDTTPRNIVITPKQMEVLSYLAQGYQNKEIAYKMGLSVSTIKLHLAGLYLRLNVRSLISALIVAQNLGLLS